MKQITRPWFLAYGTFLIVLLLSPLVFATPEDAPALYQKKTGTTSVRILERYEITPTHILNTIERSNGSRSILFLNTDYATQGWYYEDTDKETTLTGQRTGNQIVVVGTFQGKPVQKTYSIDTSPWYQAWNRDLQQFVLSEKTRQEFWSIQENDLSIYKMVAIREKEEKLSLGS